MNSCKKFIMKRVLLLDYGTRLNIPKVEEGTKLDYSRNGLNNKC